MAFSEDKKKPKTKHSICIHIQLPLCKIICRNFSTERLQTTEVGTLLSEHSILQDDCRFVNGFWFFLFVPLKKRSVSKELRKLVGLRP